MYKADDNKVYYVYNDRMELFLTIHPTTDCTKTVQEQAVIIAKMLNGDT